MNKENKEILFYIIMVIFFIIMLVFTIYAHSKAVKESDCLDKIGSRYCEYINKSWSRSYGDRFYCIDYDVDERFVGDDKTELMFYFIEEEKAECRN